MYERLTPSPVIHSDWNEPASSLMEKRNIPTSLTIATWPLLHIFRNFCTPGLTQPDGCHQNEVCWGQRLISGRMIYSSDVWSLSAKNSLPCPAASPPCIALAILQQLGPQISAFHLWTDQARRPAQIVLRLHLPRRWQPLIAIIHSEPNKSRVQDSQNFATAWTLPGSVLSISKLTTSRNHCFLGRRIRRCLSHHAVRPCPSIPQQMPPDGLCCLSTAKLGHHVDCGLVPRAPQAERSLATTSFGSACRTTRTS